MRKGLKRSGILLIAIGILALAYHFGNQTGSSIPYEPTPYEPADLAPPTPIVEDTPGTDSMPVIPDANDLIKPSFIQPVSSLSHKVKIISVNAAPFAPVEMKSNPAIDEAKPVALESTPVKSTPSIIPERTQEESSTPVPLAPRRRVMDDDDVAWHVIAGPGGKNGPSAERFFPEPGSMSLGPPDGVVLHESPKPAMATSIPPAPVETTKRKEDTPQNLKPGPPPKPAPSTAQPIPVRSDESKVMSNESPAKSEIQHAVAGSALQHESSPITHQSSRITSSTPPSNKLDPQQSKPEANTKLYSPPVTPSASPPGPIPLKTQPSNATRASDRSVVARISDLSVGTRSPDPSVVARSPNRDTQPKGPPSISGKGQPKIKIIALYPKPPEAKAAENTTKLGIREPAPKLAAAVSVAHHDQSSLPPMRARIESLQSAPESNRPKTKITDLPPVPLESKAPSRPAKSGIQQVVAVSSAKPDSNPVKLAVIRNVQPVLVKPQTRPPEKPAVSTEGLVFLPPAELPTGVTAAATEFATQKLMARSLSSPTGVAARLAHARVNSSGPDGSELILAGALMDQSAVDDGHPPVYSTTGVVQLTASKEEIAAKAHLDYVTSGMIILGEPEGPGTPTPASMTERNLKTVIRAACGDMINDLEIRLESDRTLHIRVKAPGATEQELRQTILALPDLADFKIQLNIQISS